MQRVTSIKTVSPFFPKGAVVACFASSDFFSDFLCVSLASLIEHASPNRNYDFLVLVSDMSQVNQSMLCGLCSGYSNISIRIVDISDHLKNIGFKLPPEYPIHTFYRLLLPEIMSCYDKVIYLDADVTAQTDIGALYDVNMDGMLLAASPDMFLNSHRNADEQIASYMRSIGIEDNEMYYQAGVLVFNIREMLRRDLPQRIIRESCSKCYRWCDQDVLNIFCKGSILPLDIKWDFLVLPDCCKTICEQHMPEKLKISYLAAQENPCVVHFPAGMLPPLNPAADNSWDFWKYARHTPCYERLLAKMPHATTTRLQEQTDRLNTELAQLRQQLEEVKKRLFPTVIKYKLLLPLLNLFFPPETAFHQQLRRLYRRLRGRN